MVRKHEGQGQRKGGGTEELKKREKLIGKGKREQNDEMNGSEWIKESESTRLG